MPSESKERGLANPTYAPIPHPPVPYKTFNSFYPFYLGEHSNRLNRLFHLIGTSIAVSIYARIALSLLPRIIALISRDRNQALIRDLSAKLGLTAREVGRWLAIGLLQGYACAWVGHFFVEKNRPATFKYPLFSLRGDFRMLWEVLTLQRSI